MAEAIGLAASIIAVLQLTNSCLKSLRKRIGPSSHSTSELYTIETTLYKFHGEISNFRTHLELHEEDKARLLALRHLTPVVDRCDDSLKAIQGFAQKAGSISKYTTGAKFDRKLKDCLENLERAKELFSTATILLGVEKYIRCLSKDIKASNDNVTRGLERLQQDSGQISRQIKRQERRSEEQVILNWLHPFDYLGLQDDIFSRRQNGTGKWLIGSSEFQSWLRAGNETLFCHGAPGAGKTVLSSVVVDHLCQLFRGDDAVGVAYFFCNFAREEQQSSASTLLALTKQLAQGQPRLHPALYSRVFIIIDALDECQPSSGHMLDFLATLSETQTHERVNLSFLLTSRPIPEIQERLPDNVQIEIRALDDDVRAYLDGNISRLPGFVRRGPGLQNEIKDVITGAADGMFLLAQLHLESLIGCKSPKNLKRDLKLLPRGSDASHAAYEATLSRIRGQPKNQWELARQVLSWLTFAKRELTTQELRHALAVETGEHDVDPDNLPDMQDLVSACLGLAVVDSKTDVIRLVHYTAYEYLRQLQDPHRNLPGDHHPELSEHDVAHICLTYLLFPGLGGEGPCENEGSMLVRLNNYPLLRYAAVNWGFHAQKQQNKDPVSGLIQRFLGQEMNMLASVQVMKIEGLNSEGFSKVSGGDAHQLWLAAHFDLADVCEALLKGGADPNETTSNGSTALYEAAANGNTRAMRALLVHGATLHIGTTHRRTPAHEASRRGHVAVIKLLLDYNVDVDVVISKTHRTLLHEACSNGQEKVVQLLLGRKANVHAKATPDKWTPIHAAASNGNEAIIKLLLDSGASISAMTSSGETPLTAAVVNRRIDACRLLLQSGASGTWADAAGDTPVHEAARRGYSDVILCLASFNTDMDCVNELGQRPLHLAAKNGHPLVAELLLTYGAAVDSVTASDGKTPLHEAAEGGSVEVVELLLRKGADLHARNIFDEYSGSINIDTTDYPSHNTTSITELGPNQEGVEPQAKDCEFIDPGV
ncbi:hypothetical protein QBC44DRAFT_386935 [Cladorrhinum sp. PSN332]|nr:hypothetical protein QBC44DRAFT_386935 [Cladorrhinum sp. PSN332]